MNKETQVKRALAAAVESALSAYLVEMAGQDFPRDEEVVLEEYTFEVSKLENLMVSVRAKHRSNNVAAYHFTVKVAGS